MNDLCTGIQRKMMIFILEMSSDVPAESFGTLVILAIMTFMQLLIQLVEAVGVRIVQIRPIVYALIHNVTTVSKIPLHSILERIVGTISEW